jgi:hypothetical protein
MWLDIIKMLVTIAQHFKETNVDQRERISKLYSEMSELLVETAKDLNADVYPHGKCATMWTLSENLLDYLKDKVNDEELTMLHQMLRSCSQLEREFATRKDEETINQLFKAAGRLQALSILYSV